MAELRLLRREAPASAQQRVWTLSWEWVLYAAMAAMALLLFGSELHLVPMGAEEARQALVSWRFVDVNAPGADLVPSSPLVFLAQSTAFALFGGGEGYARIGTALAGVALVLAPLLLRRSLGSGRALLLSAILLCSPVVIITARSSSPLVWAALLAMLILWAGERYWVTRARGWGIALLVLLAMLMFMVGPGGLLLAITLVAAAFMTWLGGSDDDDEDDYAELTHGEHLRRLVSSFPWARGIGIAALFVVALGTIFLIYPSGLTALGNVVLDTVAGFAQRTPDVPPFFVMLISLFYEPWLWLLAIAVAVWLSRGNNPAPTFLDRLSLTWLALNCVISLLFIGAHAENAVWITLPLALVASRLALAIFAPSSDDTPGWAMPLIATLALGLLAMGSLAFQNAARSFARLDFMNPSWVQQVDLLGFVILLIVLAFGVVGYFLVRSFWESDRLPLRALAMALLVFSAFTGVGAGWRSAVTEVDNPIDFWQRGAPSRDGLLLRETLMELADRLTRGYPEMEISVLSGGDPLVEWAVRDFSAARFVNDYASASGAPVLLALANSDFDRSPPLDGNYVGQDFRMSRYWGLENLRGQDIPQWWSQHRALTESIFIPNQAVLWVRTDVYASGSNE
jgi:hypothetical protein